MLTKALFLDRDGVINHDLGHVHKIADIIFIDDKLSHLENVTTFGIKSFLALWGYISP